VTCVCLREGEGERGGGWGRGSREREGDGQRQMEIGWETRRASKKRDGEEKGGREIKRNADM
jgi:hypothetical protein